MKHTAIIFNRESIYKEVAKTTSYIGDKKVGDDTAYDRIFTTDENSEMLDRWLNLMIAECVEMLVPYTKAEVIEKPTPTEDKVYTSVATYTINLTLPDTFSQTTLNLIEQLLHEYVLDKLVANWLSMADPESFAHWEAKAIATKQKISTALLTRRKPMRRKLHPF